jgi:hypothetical protein
MTYYCERWGLRKKSAARHISCEEAKRRHLDGEPYVAVVTDDNERPEYVVTVTVGSVSVRFLDSESRSSLMYSFRQLDDEKLFLTQATWWSYDGVSEACNEKIMFTMSRDGRVFVTVFDSSGTEIEERETIASVDGNWEPFPSFGEYDSLFKRERITAAKDWVETDHG